jgi:DNA polymerase elongation subunit (family B)
MARLRSGYRHSLTRWDLLKSTKDLRILDFDIETRKIGFHDAGRFAPGGCEVVVLAASWEGSDTVKTWSLTPRWSEKDARAITEAFVKLFNEADAVTGHYIRKFDLPILNGACLEWGYPSLSEKLVFDTKTDLAGVAGLSQSQENLSALKRLDADKFHMPDNNWRAVARLTPEGLALAEERVVDDVKQHKALRASLGAWVKPDIWKP